MKLFIFSYHIVVVGDDDDDGILKIFKSSWEHYHSSESLEAVIKRAEK